MNFKNVLTLSSHTDDMELAAGGTVAKLIEKGCNVSHVAFASVEESREECIKSMAVLGIDDYRILSFRPLHFPDQRQEIQQFLYDYNERNKIDLVLCPSSYDIHQDHYVINQEVTRAFKGSTILGYIQPWNHIKIYENCFVKLEKRQIEKKIEALWKYKSQLKRGRKYFNKKYLESLAITAGMRIGCEYAEVFEVIKLIYVR